MSARLARSSTPSTTSNATTDTDRVRISANASAIVPRWNQTAPISSPATSTPRPVRRRSVLVGVATGGP
jgi:hypothetical protein